MRGTLHSITRRPEPNAFDVSVSIGEGPPETHRVSYVHHPKEGDMSAAIAWDTGELLSRLTTLGDRGLVDNFFYELEMIYLLHAFDRGEAMPALPVELGTTRFWKPPGIIRIFRNKLRRFFWRRGFFLKRLPA
jgi:hypothetical protein